MMIEAIYIFKYIYVMSSLKFCLRYNIYKYGTLERSRLGYKSKKIWIDSKTNLL